MKAVFLIYTILILSSCGILDSQKAVNYNDSLVEPQLRISTQISEFVNFIYDSVNNISDKDKVNFQKPKQLCDQLLEDISAAKKEIKEVGAYKGSYEFNISVLKVMDAYETGLKNEFLELTNYYLLPSSEQSWDGFIDIESRVIQADSIIMKSEDNFIEAQKKFAKENSFRLITQ